MGPGLVERRPCVPHSQVLMGAELVERRPCLPHSQVLIGAGFAERDPPPQLTYGCLSTTQSGPYGC